jgi:Villin headpiece domain
MHSPSHQQCVEEDPAAAKRRIEQELAKIRAATQQTRVQKMKALVGEQASPVKERKGHVILSHELYSKKGTLPEEKKKADLEELLPDITTENTLQARKEAYATKIEEFSKKGKEYLKNEHGELMEIPILSSPVKEYKALAANNAQNSSSLSAPTLFAYDPVQDANHQVAQATKNTTSQSSSSSLSATKNALTPQNWDGTTFYSLVDLRQRRVPKDIDWKNREQYLTDEEFQQSFQMSKHEFAAQPKWKRDKLKQGLYLF